MTREQPEDPTVSVVIPTYERPAFLVGAIETVLGQTYDDTEVVVVDDGSSQRYASDVVAKFPESVRLVSHEENKGLSAARNTGIRHAAGEYIAFLDDDDRWHKTKLARQVGALEEQPKVGLATCLVAAIRPDREIVHCETSAPQGDCSEELLIGNQIGTPSRVLIRRECFKGVGMFDEQLPTKQDWDLYLRLCQDWEVAAVEDHLCFRTVHESMSSSPRSAKRDNLAILAKHEDLLRPEGVWAEANAEGSARVGRAYLNDGDLGAARKHLKKAVWLEPSIYRVILFLLSWTHPSVVQTLAGVKRRIGLARADCTDIVIGPEEIPGIMSHGGA